MPAEPYNITPIKLADPAEQYGNALKNAYLMNQISEAKSKRDDTNAMREAYSTEGAAGPDGANIVRNALSKKRGDLLPSYDKTQADIAYKKAQAGKLASDKGKAEADMSKSEAEAIHKSLENSKTELMGISMDPSVGQDQMFNHIKAVARDPALKKWIEGRYGTSEEYIKQRVAEMLPASRTPDAWQQHVISEQTGAKDNADMLKKVLTPVDQGDKHVIVATDPRNPGAGSQTVWQGAEGLNPNRPQHVINVNNNPENKGLASFNEEAAKDAIKDYRTKRSGAESAGMGVQNIDQMQKLLNDGVFVGALGKPQEDVTRYAKALGFNVNDGMIVRSQELRKMLSKNVYDQVAALKAAGVPLSRLTNAELKLVQEASPGMEMEPETIKTLLSAQRKMQQNLVIAHNQRYGEMTADPRTGDTMRLYGYHPIDIPGVPPAAIEALRQHPEKAAGFDKAFGLPAGSAKGMLEQAHKQPAGGGSPSGQTPFSAPGPGGTYKTSVGNITYDQNAGVQQWMPLVTKHAPSYGVDPELVRLIMDKESSGNPLAHNGTMNADGSWDHGLMQVNSVHRFSQQQLSDPEFNIRQGMQILADSLKAHPGNLFAGIKGYNGSGPKADKYAADILSRYKGPGLVRQ